jgi:hypothetical protein
MALAAAALFAAEPWKAKKYTEWTVKEVERILKDSPWAKAVSVSPPDVAPAGGGRGGGGRGGGGGGRGGHSGPSRPAEFQLPRFMAAQVAA